MLSGEALFADKLSAHLVPARFDSPRALSIDTIRELFDRE
jgi:hypothetical protein